MMNNIIKYCCPGLLLWAAILSSSAQNKADFASPERSHYPETWFHYISGNVSKAGVTADLEAIASAGISGVHLFHGHFTDDVWPGVETPVKCLGPLWNDALNHTARECQRLGMKFTMQNCPGWAMSGGPWIEPQNTMRHVMMSNVNVEGGKFVNVVLPQPGGNEEWRDYRDIAVLAFPTPDGEGASLPDFKVKSSDVDVPWERWLKEDFWDGVTLKPASEKNPHVVELTFDSPVTLRSVELPCIQSANHHWCYEPDIRVKVYSGNGNASTLVADVQMPQCSWQDDHLMTIALDEAKANKYRIEVINGHDITFNHFKVFQAARKNNWESEAGRTLRGIERSAALPNQSKGSFVDAAKIIDISDKMDADGHLKWNAPAGKWTVLRFGHVNTGQQNAPAPVEGTGWECNKLSKTGSNIHYNGYIGRLSAENGPVGYGLLKGVLIDSWECHNQTWTDSMDADFMNATGYELRKWMPALFGYVVGDHETTTQFLRDWRRTINDMIVENYFGNMAALANQNGLTIQYETAIGDVVPGDILKFYKYADVPMCEFWHPVQRNFVGSDNFKPIVPTVSAARMYGKPRVAAEAFTSFEHTWTETPAMLKDIANKNMIDGVSHLVFHTYTHNPQVNFLPPGTSFGGQGIGTPFLRGQTWWHYMHLFTDYLARCSYMLEEGVPVSDVLWYLSDEMDIKPDQNYQFPKGYKFDYCNSDVLINRLSVDTNGNIVTPEGLSYKMLWIPENRRMMPSTLKRLYEMIEAGAVVVADAPLSPATLAGGNKARKEFNKFVKNIWGKNPGKTSRKIGKGTLLSGYTLEDAIAYMHLSPDVTSDCGGTETLWAHRRSADADWYFLAAPHGQSVAGYVKLSRKGCPQLWNPVDGSVSTPNYKMCDNGTCVAIDMPVGGSCFIVFSDNDKDAPSSYTAANKVKKSLPLKDGWRLSFPAGWGAPESIALESLAPWNQISTLSDEAKAFSGTATYEIDFNADSSMINSTSCFLNLGRVANIAEVEINGAHVGTLWCEPYCIDVSGKIKQGENKLKIKVTNTWFNRLVYDSSLQKEQRKTWAVNLPAPNQPLLPAGLTAPITIEY